MRQHTRRYIIKASAVNFLYLCDSFSALADSAVRANGSGFKSLNWNAFIDKLESIAAQQHRFAWDQAGYVRDVAALAGQLNLKDLQLKRLHRGDRNSVRSALSTRLYPEIQDVLHTMDVQVSLIEFEKGQIIPCHDHPGMTGVMACATGGVVVQDYDVIGRPISSDWLLRSTGTQTLRPGDVSTLTSTARNIHKVGAPVSGQLLDIFTPPYDRNRTVATHWLDLEPHPIKGTGDVFFARPYRAP